MQHIVIIGNGISGVTAARHIRKGSNHRITLISAESEHFFSRTALMYIYMGHLRYEHTKPYEDGFWAKNRIELKKARVQRVDIHQKQLHLEADSPLAYDILIIAVGSEPRRGNWPGHDLTGVQGLYSLQDLENMEHYTTNISRGVVVGGGLIGVEMAEMLLSRQIPVTFLVRESDFWRSVLPAEEARMISRHIRSHHVDLRLGTELREIMPDAEGRVRAVVTAAGETIPCSFVGLTIGVQPNIRFLRDSGIALDRGVLVNEFFETSVPDVYAIGDCAEFREALPGRKKIEQIWYTGRMHGETLAQTLCGSRTAYRPGVFFNSAKFFDIEYQTYGYVPHHTSEDETSFYWEHPDGQHCLRIHCRERDLAVFGFNAFGIRLRHEVCERWIRQEKSLAYVVAHLAEANFDPEFYRRNESAIRQLFHQQYPEQPAALPERKGLFQRFFS